MALEFGSKGVALVVHILLYFTHFFWRQDYLSLFGAWEHIPRHIWRTADGSNSAGMQDDGGSDAEFCALCCQKHPTPLRGEYNENYCAECIDPHIVRTKLFIRHNTCYILY